MDRILEGLFGLVAALSALTGAPFDTGNMPDRPAIVAPTPVAEIEIKGTVQNMQGNVLLVDAVRVIVGSNAKVKGLLRPGVVVEVQGIQQPDGSVIARQVQVSEDRRQEARPDDKKGDDHSSSGSDVKSGNSSSSDSGKSTENKSDDSSHDSDGSGDSDHSADDKSEDSTEGEHD